MNYVFVIYSEWISSDDNYCKKNIVAITPEKYTDDTISKIEKHLNKLSNAESIENIKLPNMGERLLVAKNKQSQRYTEYYIERIEII